MTKIEWTEQTWNPIVGCSIISPGCTNCYAMKMAARLATMCGDGLDDNGYAVRGTGPLDHYRGVTKGSKAGAMWTGEIALAPDETLTKPLRRRNPTTYFVNSMSDLFHEDVPDEWIDRVFAVMALTPRHTYQVLTKRSARMRAYISSLGGHHSTDRVSLIAKALQPDGPGFWWHSGNRGFHLPNVWLGVSAERQQEADARIPDLLATPAAVRFVSAEPLLGPIDFTRIGDACGPHDALGVDLATSYEAIIDWVICGGESGRRARPMHPDWARSIRDQCQAADVPFFFKQRGEWVDHGPAWGTAAVDEHPGDAHWLYLDSDGTCHRKRETAARCARAMERVGKASAGRLLDGRTWDEMPSTAAQRTPAPTATEPV